MVREEMGLPSGWTLRQDLIRKSVAKLAGKRGEFGRPNLSPL